MANRLFVAWQDDATRKWHTVARLTKTESGYEFVFTKGVERLKSVPKEVFGMDQSQTYTFDNLIPLFKNRIPPRSRSDFARISNWLGVRPDAAEFDLLSKFGLIPGTDSLLLYPQPDVSHGAYRLEFFVHGIRHMPKDVLTWCDDLEVGGRLLPLLDVQNPADIGAVALRGENNTILVGYVPGFYALDVRKLLIDESVCPHVRITVVRNNSGAPLQLRLLCRIEAPLPAGFDALAAEAHSVARKPDRAALV